MTDQPLLPFRDPLGVDALGGRVLGKQDTSRQAAFDGLSRVTKDRRRILAYVTSTGPHGATQDDASAGLLMHHGTASARFKELRDAGFIQRTGDRRRTRSGSTAHVHRTTPSGRDALAASLAYERAQAGQAAAAGAVAAPGPRPDAVAAQYDDQADAAAMADLAAGAARMARTLDTLAAAAFPSGAP